MAANSGIAPALEENETLEDFYNRTATVLQFDENGKVILRLFAPIVVEHAHPFGEDFAGSDVC